MSPESSCVFADEHTFVIGFSLLRTTYDDDHTTVINPMQIKNRNRRLWLLLKRVIDGFNRRGGKKRVRAVIFFA